MTLHPITIDAAGGEYMDSVLVIGWHKAPGDAVAAGDLLLTVETAKAATDIEATQDGWLAEIRFAEGQEAPVGAVLGQLTNVKGESAAPGTAAPNTAAPGTAAPEPGASAPAPEATPDTTATRVIASPLARRVAAERGIALAGITGSGPRGRIKLRDVERTPRRQASAVPAAVPAPDRRVPLVLLHGFAADAASWRQVRALIPAGIETIALDLPGHGKEGGAPEPTLARIVERLDDRLDDLGLDEIHLAGHSLGGAVAIALATSGRHVVRSLSLIAPAGVASAIDTAFISGVLDAETPEALQVWLCRMVADAGILPDGFAEAALLQMRRNANREALRLMARGLFPNGHPAFDLAPALARIAVPLRILWGRDDRIIPPAPMPDLPGRAALHLLPGTGHVPQLEDPALCARLLTETLRSAG